MSLDYEKEIVDLKAHVAALQAIVAPIAALFLRTFNEDARNELMEGIRYDMK